MAGPNARQLAKDHLIRANNNNAHVVRVVVVTHNLNGVVTLVLHERCSLSPTSGENECENSDEVFTK